MTLKEATDERLDQIARDIAAIAPVIREAANLLLAGEVSFEKAESVRRSAETLLDLWTLEADLIRRGQARKR